MSLLGGGSGNDFDCIIDLIIILIVLQFFCCCVFNDRSC